MCVYKFSYKYVYIYIHMYRACMPVESMDDVYTHMHVPKHSEMDVITQCVSVCVYLN